MSATEFPRRQRVDQYSPGEKAIYDAMGVVEGMGADPLLTEAVVLLGKAREKVADFVDKSADCGHGALFKRADLQEGVEYCIKCKGVPPEKEHPTPLFKKRDMVNDPPHYGGKDNPYEVIKVLRAWGYYDNAPRFNSIKYLARAGKKGDIVEDLKKAIYYVQAEITDIEEHRRKKDEEKS